MVSRQPLHLCFLADLGSAHTQRWLRFYIERGHRVSAITFRPGPDIGASVHLVSPIVGGKARYVIAAPAVRRLVRSLAPDVLHAHHATSYGLLGAVARWHPFVITCHGSDLLVTPKRSPILGKSTAWALAQADIVTAPSAELELAALKLTSGRVRPHVFQYGLDLSLWRYRERTPTGRLVRIVSTRELGALYDVATLIRAMPIVRQYIDQVEVVVCSDGPQRSALERLTVELGVSDVVRFLGPLSEEALAGELRDADIYVSTSLSDGLSMSLLEAMATGLYPVVSDIPANRALIIDGTNGSLFPPQAAESLATAIIDAARRGDDHLRVRQQNRMYVEQHADRGAILGRFERCYYALARGDNRCEAGPVLG